MNQEFNLDFNTNLSWEHDNWYQEPSTSLGRQVIVTKISLEEDEFYPREFTDMEKLSMQIFSLGDLLSAAQRKMEDMVNRPPKIIADWMSLLSGEIRSILSMEYKLFAEYSVESLDLLQLVVKQSKEMKKYLVESIETTPVESDSEEVAIPSEEEDSRNYTQNFSVPSGEEEVDASLEWESLTPSFFFEEEINSTSILNSQTRGTSSMVINGFSKFMKDNTEEVIEVQPGNSIQKFSARGHLQRLVDSHHQQLSSGHFPSQINYVRSLFDRGKHAVITSFFCVKLSFNCGCQLVFGVIQLLVLWFVNHAEICDRQLVAARPEGIQVSFLSVLVWVVIYCDKLFFLCMASFGYKLDFWCRHVMVLWLVKEAVMGNAREWFAKQPHRGSILKRLSNRDRYFHLPFNDPHMLIDHDRPKVTPSVCYYKLLLPCISSYGSGSHFWSTHYTVIRYVSAARISAEDEIISVREILSDHKQKARRGWSSWILLMIIHCLQGYLVLDTSRGRVILFAELLILSMLVVWVLQGNDGEDKGDGVPQHKTSSCWQKWGSIHQPTASVGWIGFFSQIFGTQLLFFGVQQLTEYLKMFDHLRWKFQGLRDCLLTLNVIVSTSARLFTDWLQGCVNLDCSTVIPWLTVDLEKLGEAVCQYMVSTSFVSAQVSSWHKFLQLLDCRWQLREGEVSSKLLGVGHLFFDSTRGMYKGNETEYLKMSLWVATYDPNYWTTTCYWIFRDKCSALRDVCKLILIHTVFLTVTYEGRWVLEISNVLRIIQMGRGSVARKLVGMVLKHNLIIWTESFLLKTAETCYKNCIRVVSSSSRRIGERFVAAELLFFGRVFDRGKPIHKKCPILPTGCYGSYQLVQVAVYFSGQGTTEDTAQLEGLRRKVVLARMLFDRGRGFELIEEVTRHWCKGCGYSSWLNLSSRFWGGPSQQNLVIQSPPRIHPGRILRLRVRATKSLLSGDASSEELCAVKPGVTARFDGSDLWEVFQKWSQVTHSQFSDQKTQNREDLGNSYGKQTHQLGNVGRYRVCDDASVTWLMPPSSMVVQSNERFYGAVTIGEDTVISAYRLSEDRSGSLVGASLSKVVPVAFSTISSFSSMIWSSKNFHQENQK